MINELIELVIIYTVFKKRNELTKKKTNAELSMLDPKRS